MLRAPTRAIATEREATRGARIAARACKERKGQSSSGREVTTQSQALKSDYARQPATNVPMPL